MNETWVFLRLFSTVEFQDRRVDLWEQFVLCNSDKFNDLKQSFA